MVWTLDSCCQGAFEQGTIPPSCSSRGLAGTTKTATVKIKTQKRSYKLYVALALFHFYLEPFEEK